MPAPATTGVLLELRAWQGREEESRALAEMTAQWGRQRGAAILEVFALMGLTVLELGLSRYAEALSSGMLIYDDDPPGFGNRILPEIVEAGARSGGHDAARAALARLDERATASGTPWALGMLARSQALLTRGAEAETLYGAAIAYLTGTSIRTELARTHLLYGEWLRLASAVRMPGRTCGRRETCSTPWGRQRSPAGPEPSCWLRVTAPVSPRTGQART